MVHCIWKLTTHEASVSLFIPWKIEDANWNASNTILRDNDLLIHTVGDTRYLNWWAISDLNYIHSMPVLSHGKSTDV